MHSTLWLWWFVRIADVFAAKPLPELVTRAQPETLIVPAQRFIVSFQAHLGEYKWKKSGLHKSETEDD